MMGAYRLCALTTSHAYGFSAPEVLEGVPAMVLNGAHSHRSGERGFHCIIPWITIAVGYLVASYAHALSVVIAALEASFIAFMSMQGPALAIPTQFLAGKAAAARNPRYEHHHHVQRLHRTRLDGHHERCNRQLSSRAQRMSTARPRCRRIHVRAVPQSEAPYSLPARRRNRDSLPSSARAPFIKQTSPAGCA
jgi:hypothetical protein